MVDSYEREEYLLFSGFDESGQSVPQETMEKLFSCSARIEEPGDRLGVIPASVSQRLGAETEPHARATVSRSLEENSRHFNEARDRLEKWADDPVRDSLNRSLKGASIFHLDGSSPYRWTTSNLAIRR